MGCCKSRGGLFSDSKDLKNVPEKYRNVKNETELKSMIEKEIADMMKPDETDNLLENLKADLDNFKNQMLG